MPVIHHKDIEIHYEPHPLIPHLKVFHQDLYAISYDTDTGIELNPEGQAKEDLLRMGYEHPNNAYAKYRFNEDRPKTMPSYDYLNCLTRKKVFRYPDIINNSGIIGPNQLLISWRLMGLFRKFRMAPHITIPAVIKFRDTFIEDNYLVLYFYHHGCDHVVWDKTVFGFVDLKNDLITSTFDLSDLNNLKLLYSNLPKQKFALLKITFLNKYAIFYSFLGNRIYIDKDIYREICDNNHYKFTGVKCTGNRFETELVIV